MVLSVPDPPLTDGVVTLRPPDESDLSAIERGILDPDVIRWFEHQNLQASILRSYADIDGRRVDYVVFSLLPGDSDWRWDRG